MCVWDHLLTVGLVGVNMEKPWERSGVMGRASGAGYMGQVTLTGVFGGGVPGPKKPPVSSTRGRRVSTVAGVPECCSSHYNPPTSGRPTWAKG